MDKCLETSGHMKTDEEFSVRLLVLPDTVPQCHLSIISSAGSRPQDLGGGRGGGGRGGGHPDP